MKFIKTLILGVSLLFTTNVAAQKKSIYEYTVKDIYGKDVKMSEYMGKKIIIVNVASECGLTPQYEKLQELYETYKDKGLVVIGFPANNFNKQEPGSNAEIISFCESKFAITFPMMSKISVKGEDIAPIYEWLTKKSLNGVMNSKVIWNFQKYLIDREGYLVKKIIPTKSPLSKEIIKWVTAE